MSELFEIISEIPKNSPPEVDYNSLPTDSTGGEYPSEVVTRPQPEGAIATSETFLCDYCGHCETPNDCAWAHECPKCGAPAGKIDFSTYCKTPTGGITGLHAERWAA